MSSSADRADIARANSRPTREEILAWAASDFPDEDATTVTAILDEYGTRPHERERERVQRAILMLADGDVEKLQKYTQVAKRDYRNVLLWAEYPESKDS